MSSPVAERDGRRLAIRLSLLFAAVNMVTGTLLPYLPVWLDWVGLTPREIAVITAMPLLVRVAVSPGIAFAADRSGDHRGFIVVLAWSSLAAAVALAHSASFWPILALTLAFSVAAGTVMPLAETVAMAGVRHSGLDYGRMRLWGSLTFIAASAYGGLALDRFGPPAALWLLAGGAVCVALASHALPRPSARPPTAAARPRISLAEALGLVRSRLFVTFLAAVGAVQAAHATFYTFGTLHWVAQGYSSGWSGALWGIGVGIESSAPLRRWYAGSPWASTRRWRRSSSCRRCTGSPTAPPRSAPSTS
jgi:PPP family 3-phenylpropionic acid transporter